jgi:hypothetical protein
VVVADRRHRHARLDHLAAVAQVAALEAAGACGAVDERGQGRGAGGAIGRVRELGQAPPDELLGGAPRHLADGLVDALDPAVAGGDDAADRRLFERDPVALEALAAAGDVVDGADRERAAVDLHPAHAQLHREGGAVLAAPGALADDRRERLPDHLRLVVVAELAQGRRVDRLDHARLGGGDDPLRHVLQDRSRAHLAVNQRAVELHDRLDGILQLLRAHDELHERRDLRPQHGGEDRREHEVDGAAGVGRRGLELVVAEGGEEDDRRQLRAGLLADPLRRLVAVEGLPPRVHHDHGEALVRDSAQGVRLRFGARDSVAQRSEHPANRAALPGVGVDDENRRACLCVTHLTRRYYGPASQRKHS